MSLPTPYTVERYAYEGVQRDKHGNTTDVWDDTAQVLPVHGWAPPTASSESNPGNRTLVVRDLDVYAPSGTDVGPQDQMVVDGVRYDVVGYAEDYGKGPWEWAAGLRINLRLAEG